jgi:hypothetical protein
MLQSGDYLSSMAHDGLSVPTYAYALNNPLRYSDQTGLGAEEWGPQGIRQAGEAVKLVVIAGGAGAASGGAGASVAGGVLVVSGGGVVVGSAAVAATVVVGSGQFPDPGAGTPGLGAPSPTPNAPQPHPPAEPGCPPTGKSCSEKRAEDRKICEEFLMIRGLSRTKAKEICWVCASVDYSYCIGNIQRAMELALRCESALKRAGQTSWR